jgi:hypothetical protein
LKASRSALGVGKADAVADLLAREQASDQERMAATEVALAQPDLQRIRAERVELLAELDLTSGDVDSLRRPAALDRYERLAHTKRRRASRKL